jgi:tRNA nucleotidyltransferase (CCA-adding enzyme)
MTSTANDETAAGRAYNNDEQPPPSPLPSLGPRNMSIDDSQSFSVAAAAAAAAASSSSSSVECDRVSIPTTVKTASLSLQDDAPNNTTAQQQNSPAVSSSLSPHHSSVSHVHIHLDPQEERLFDVIVEACAAFGRGDFKVASAAVPGSTGTSRTNDGTRPNMIMMMEPCNLTVRVAGGWVRDKLLGLQTHDVDLAVDLVKGIQLATLLQSYIKQKQQQQQLQQQSQEQAQQEQQQEEDFMLAGRTTPATTTGSHQGDDGNDDDVKKQSDQKQKSKSDTINGNSNSVCGRIGVIAANPAQSKHLETATMRIYGMDLDMANLRAQEIYTSDSRIPVVRMGTPREDAERRDFTVNALFFNLQTRLVEDWTGRGLHDLLIAKRLVTPLEPVQTFRDDPLRVLRAIRFAVRYQFQLDTAIQDACRLDEIHKALHVKVSRERVGKELEGMLSGKGANPVRALEMISRLQLAGSVFCLPKVGTDNVTAVKGHVLGQDYTGLDFDSDMARCLRKQGWQESQLLLKLLPRILQSHDTLAQQRPTASRRDDRLLPVGVYLLPFRTLKFEETKRSNNNSTSQTSSSGSTKTCNVAPYIFREGIKFKNKDVQAITVLEETVDRFMDFMCQVAADTAVDPTTAFCRLDTGLLLRTTKGLWPNCLIMATVLLVRKQQCEENTDGGVRSTNSAAAMTSSDPNINKIDWLNVADQVYNAICDLSLDECWNMKPLLDGKAVIQALALPRGPSVGTFLEEQVKWMLLNPNGSREECEAHLQSIKRHHDECMVDSTSSNNLVGLSDGINTTTTNPQARHFSKKMHVESMELS